MTKSNEFILNSTQQMEEELNGIVNDTDENMHLLDLFNDNFFTNKFIDNKDQFESDNVYNLNNDDLDLDNLNNFDYNLNQISTSNYSTTNNLTQQKETIENLSPISFHNSSQQNSIINHISNQNSFKNYQANFNSTNANQSTITELELDQNGKIQANQMTNLNKQNRTKKIKNLNSQQSKKKTPKIKFHEYKGPQNSMQKYSKDQLDTNLDKFKEQQNIFQKQLLNQFTINAAKLKGTQQIPNNNLQQVKETVPLKINVPFNTSGLNQQENSNSFSITKTNQISNSEVKSNSPKSLQTNDENIIKNNKFIAAQDIFRYSPTNENQHSIESKDQFSLDLGSSQLTPPYQQSTNLNNLNSNNSKPINETSLVPLNELNIEKLEELTVQDLKMYLKKYALPISATKKVQLVERLKNFILKNKTISQNQTNGLNNFQSNQLTPPNTPMELDQHSDSDDTSKYTNTNNKTNPILNSSNHLFNGKIYVNNSHFSTQIPLNSIPYTIHQNQIQFQNSQNPTNNANSFTLPIASIQPQIHFLNNPIITNTANQQQISNQLSQQLTNTSLTVHHPQLTTIPQNTLSNTTIVATTPILLYSRNSVTNSTSIDPFNQQHQQQQQTNQQQINANDLMNESNKSSINSVKLSIRKNILLKQKKQEQKQLQMNQKTNKQSKNINNEKIIDKQQEIYSINTNKMNEIYQTNYFTPNNDQEMKIENKIEEKNDFELLMEIKEVADFINETDNNKDNKENDDLNKIEKFDYLNKAKEDYSNKTSHTRQVILDQIDRIDQINKEDELNQLKQLEAKNNLEFNDMDSILNCEINDLEISNLNTVGNNLINEDDFTDFWLNNQDNLIDSNIVNNTNNDLICNVSCNETEKESSNSKIEQEQQEYNFKNNENTNFLSNLMESSPIYKGECSKNDDFQNYIFCNNSKQSNFFETTNCNFMDPAINNFYSDQTSPFQYLDENDLNFKISKPDYTNSEFNISFDKNNFTAY